MSLILTKVAGGTTEVTQAQFDTAKIDSINDRIYIDEVPYVLSTATEAETVGTSQIENLSIAEADLATDSITTAKIADNAVVTAGIADNAITSAKILADNVTTAKIADDAVTTAKILNDNVTTAKILDNSVTLAKLALGTLGDLLTAGVGGVWTILPIGTAAQTLKMNVAATDVEWA